MRIEHFTAVLSLLGLSIIFVPMDDRPAPAPVPQLISEIAGVRFVEPPAATLVNYLDPGAPRAILRGLDAVLPDVRNTSFRTT